MKTTHQIRAAFLDYFANQGHSVRPSSSLVPVSDPTLMFTNAGMVPFKHVFSGAETLRDASGNAITRATSSQKCIRAGGKHNDLDNVGYTARHHTFFEMLGNFSFGDYFKEGAIEHAWKLLTEIYNIPTEKLYFTVYHTDDEAFDIWKRVTGCDDSRILRIPTNDNFWSMGDTGPCGPCSEIFYDHGADAADGQWALDDNGEDQFGDRFIEIWNLVFMQYERHADGSQTDLPKPCIDTGMGLERMVAVLQDVHNNYDIDMFSQLVSLSQELSGNAANSTIGSHRVIADHLRSCAFLLAEGVRPSNEGRGYVLRRIMRRAMRHVHLLGVEEPMMHKLVPALVAAMGEHFSELVEHQTIIEQQLLREELRFKETLGRGIELLEAETATLSAGDTLNGQIAFKLYDTYGFPLDLTQDILRTRDIAVDVAAFDAAMAEQKQRARAAWKGSGDAGTDTIWFDISDQHGATEFLGYHNLHGIGTVLAIINNGVQVDTATAGDEVLLLTNQTPFYAESGGQAGDTGTLTTDSASLTVSDTQKKLGTLHVHVAKVDSGSISVGQDVTMQVDAARRENLRANHSATHLLHAALRKKLGEHVTQKGSLVEADYLRFDFSHDDAVTPEQQRAIEADIYSIIAQGGAVETAIMTPDEAKEAGAMALFGEKYGDEVRVLSMGADGYSIELCGGTHVENLADIGSVIITREGSVSSGVRRIEAVAGNSAVAYIASLGGDASTATAPLHEYAQTLLATKEQAEAEARDAKKQADKDAAAARAKALAANTSEAEVETINGTGFIGQVLDGVPPKELRGLVDGLKKQVGSGIVVIIATNDGKASIVVGVTDDLTADKSAVDFVRVGSAALGGKGGGGRPDFAQAGGPDADAAQAAIDAIKAKL